MKIISTIGMTRKNVNQTQRGAMKGKGGYKWKGILEKGNAIFLSLACNKVGIKCKGKWLSQLLFLIGKYERRREGG